jgi:3-hydroxybutyryl-CoA dehydrogenase
VPLPERIGVYGGGRMGAGIAQVLLRCGGQVDVIEASEAAVEAARSRVQAGLDVAASKDPLATDSEQLMSRLSVSSDPLSLAECSLVIEAVPESRDIKRTVFATVERVAPGAILATNTSSFSIDQLAQGLDRPAQFLGLHFFNPVPVSGLVEIVMGAATDPDLAHQAGDWIRCLGKTPIVVNDSPGFASSRLGLALALEAMRMLQDGVASASDIDAAMTLGYGHPMGPLRTTDVVGLDVRLAIADYLAEELGEKFSPPQILRSLVADGHLGRKTGRGFFDW